MPRLTLFVPMHDERESLEPLVRKALAVLAGITPDFELLLVDDGSRDGSGERADELARGEPRLRVVRHPRNLGYGQALRTGFGQARGEVVAYTDCDQPADLALLPEALRLLDDDPGLDMVIGYRLHRREGPRRWLYTRVYNTLVRALFGVRVRDVNFSFKLVRSAALRQARLSAGSAFIDGQLLSEAVRLGWRLREVPVEHQPRRHGRSHFDSLGPALATLAEMLRCWWRGPQRG